MVSSWWRRLCGAPTGDAVSGLSRRVRRAAVTVALFGALLTALPGGALAVVHFPEVPNDGWDVDGDVYAIKVAGSTVYVGGSFTEARSPGNDAKAR